jgi:hypothetical protein
LSGAFAQKSYEYYESGKKVSKKYTLGKMDLQEEFNNEFMNSLKELEIEIFEENLIKTKIHENLDLIFKVQKEEIIEK